MLCMATCDCSLEVYPRPAIKPYCALRMVLQLLPLMILGCDSPLLVPGARTTPSVVAYTKSGDRLVGQIAKRQGGV